jgi:hypothetical protein
MIEWWTYRPADFLMFSPRIYERLFELVNQAWWPLQLPLLAAGLCGLVALARGRGRALLGLGLGLAWLLCTVVFLRERYLPIHWAVGYLIPAVLLLAALLPGLAWRTRRGVAPGAPARQVALALAAWSLLLHPLLAPLGGRPWWQAEWVALAPDPTAIATLALLLALPRQPTRAWRAAATLAWALVLAWLLFSTFTLATMHSANALVLLAAMALALGARVWSWRRPEPVQRGV